MACANLHWYQSWGKASADLVSETDFVSQRRFLYLAKLDETASSHRFKVQNHSD
jgi:hypothetical protein